MRRPAFLRCCWPNSLLPEGDDFLLGLAALLAAFEAARTFAFGMTTVTARSATRSPLVRSLGGCGLAPISGFTASTAHSIMRRRRSSFTVERIGLRVSIGHAGPRRHRAARVVHGGLPRIRDHEGARRRSSTSRRLTASRRAKTTSRPSGTSRPSAAALKASKRTTATRASTSPSALRCVAFSRNKSAHAIFLHSRLFPRAPRRSCSPSFASRQWTGRARRRR